MEFVQVEMLPRVVQFTEAGMSDIFNGFIKTQVSHVEWCSRLLWAAACRIVD